MEKNTRHNVFWFRRDLRLNDNKGLFRALEGNRPVIPLFVFDKKILDRLEDEDDARVHFIHEQITRLDRELSSSGSGLLVKYGEPENVWKELIIELDIEEVFTNRDYEPYAVKRDDAVKNILRDSGIAFHTFKDQVITEAGEVVKEDGGPYVVFTPYKNKWLEVVRDGCDKLQSSPFFNTYKTKSLFENFSNKVPGGSIPTLEEMGFKKSNIPFPDMTVSQKIISQYGKNRDYPGRDATSRLGPHYRFGTISIREKALKASRLDDTYLNELIWRDFYSQILAHFPKVVDQPFREKYERVEWINDEEQFEKWCSGKTGYPLVDAGMRQLNTTGYMHNRVRMVTASFLTKHLLIDWRWGEVYFARKLLDFELASNNGGWQWAAGCGTDAAPYFRIFNPESQQKKFDKDFEYIRQYVEEFESEEYPEKIVDHKFARKRCLEVYKKALKGY